jgi:hypothetical protein
MDKQKFIAILDKNINQEGLALDLAVEYIKPSLEAILAKVESGEIDLIPGTDLEKPVVISALTMLLSKIK